jgi:hypothetical protein
MAYSTVIPRGENLRSRKPYMNKQAAIVDQIEEGT